MRDPGNEVGYNSTVAFVRRVDHSSFILSCNLIGQRENKSRYVTEIVLPLGFAVVIFRRRESRQPEIRLRSQATYHVNYWRFWPCKNSEVLYFLISALKSSYTTDLNLIDLNF